MLPDRRLPASSYDLFPLCLAIFLSTPTLQKQGLEILTEIKFKKTLNSIEICDLMRVFCVELIQVCLFGRQRGSLEEPSSYRCLVSTCIAIHSICMWQYYSLSHFSAIIKFIEIVSNYLFNVSPRLFLLSL